jgi:hypothetical protein
MIYFTDMGVLSDSFKLIYKQCYELVDFMDYMFESLTVSLSYLSFSF